MAEKPFPPPGQTSICTIIPSYLYEQYFDDEDLQAFITSQNQIAQQYLTWFCEIGLPVYTGDKIVGELLDWVAEGLYGLPRPVITTGRLNTIGPYNTWQFNSMQFNESHTLGSITVVPTSDDIYKRILTWHFYKGDGKIFSIPWLKRRVMRFLLGMNGTSPSVDDVTPVSITFPSGNDVTITVDVIGGITQQIADIFQACVQSMVVELPFQYDFTVNVT